MKVQELAEAKMYQSETELRIKQTSVVVWKILCEQTDQWWPVGFRALGEGSKMSLSPIAGGQLLETGISGETLEWYRVQMCVPERSLHLVGYVAPDWGGPKTSMLNLSISDEGGICILVVSEALTGKVTMSGAESAMDGWTEVFNSLKSLAEG